MTQETRARRDRGAVIPFMGIALAVLVLMTAFSVDLGRQMLKRRDIQAVADVISLDLARHLNGQPVSWYTNPGNTAWQSQITESRNRNGFPAPDTPQHKLEFQYGEVNAARVFTALPAAGIPTAVKVTITDTINYYFAPGKGGAVRSAVAGADGEVDWKLGSFLAAVSPLQQGLLNGLLGQGLGGPMSLTVLSYQGLANANVGLGDLAAQMGLASPDDLMTGSVNARQMVLASAQVLSAQGGNVAAIAALNAIAASMSNTRTVNVGDMIAVEQGGSAAALNTSMNVLQLLTGSASLINGNAFVDVPGLNVGIPGVGNVNVRMQVIQREVICLRCKVGTTKRNSQVELTITAPMSLVVPLPLGLFGALLNTQLTGNTIFTTSVAGATGQATAIRCGSSKGVDLGVTPDPVTITANENLTLRLLGLSLLGIVSTGTVTTTGTPGAASFDYPAEFLPLIGTGSPQRIGSATLGLTGLLGASGHATLLGGTLPLNTIVNAVNPILNPVLNLLDTVVVAEVTKALGLDLGGGDIGALDMRCVGPTLLG